jgi:hypothetical protein
MQLLVVDESKRLGCGSQGVDEIKDHPWFNGVDWDALLDCRVEPPLEIVHASRTLYGLNILLILLKCSTLNRKIQLIHSGLMAGNTTKTAQHQFFSHAQGEVLVMSVHTHTHSLITESYLCHFPEFFPCNQIAIGNSVE